MSLNVALSKYLANNRAFYISNIHNIRMQ